MSKYKFATDEFGLSDHGFHLLRSNFNFETIDFRDITLLEIEKGKIIGNWILAMLIGMVVLTVSSYYMFGVVMALNDPTIHEIYLEEIVAPIFPFAIGAYLIYSSLRTGEVIKIERGGKKASFPLTKLKKNNELKDFIIHLKQNKLFATKLKVYIED